MLYRQVEVTIQYYLAAEVRKYSSEIFFKAGVHPDYDGAWEVHGECFGETFQ